MRADYKLPTDVLASLSDDAINLIKRIFAIDANKRPSARDILSDPWFSEKQDINSFSQPGFIRSHSHQPE